MAAPKLQNLFKQDSNRDSGAQEKARLKQLISKIQERLKNPEEAKKAALVIEKLIHNK